MSRETENDIQSLASVKIVGVGLNKTGTSTLKMCLRELGYRHTSYNLDAFHMYQESDWPGLEKIMASHDSFENWPWALIYERFDKKYPEAKFILTLRKSPETWFRSLCNHAKRMGPLTDFEQYIYGYAEPAKYEREHLSYYQTHNAKVIDYFADRPEKLLVVCWETGDGWQELCEFLNIPAPELSFPHANKTQSLPDKIFNRIRPLVGRYKQKVFGIVKQMDGKD